ncbi:MAG: Trk-type K+ transporter membrane component [Desulfuromonas sp.]|nr:MAG: Trk-type K+ transporter membrane component [Desulfuromonas sp.]
MARSGFELFYAVRLRNILHYLGQFLLIVAGLNLVNVLAALLFAEIRIGLNFLLVVAILGASGYLLMRIPHRGQLQFNEAMVIAALFFLLVPVISTLPLQASGVPFIDSLFETISAVTTTGLSTLGAIESRPHSFVFARAWMQWYGGLGIVILSLAMVLSPGLSSMRLATLETEHDDLAGGTRAYAKRILLVYLVLTAGGFIVWLVLGGRPLEGLYYVLAAVSTGGFAPNNNSFADLANLRLAWSVTLLCLAGAVPLALYYTAANKGWRSLFSDIEFRAVLAAGVLTTVLLGGFIWLQERSLEAVLTHAPLMALSAQTTSGFSSMDPAALDPASKAVMIFAMSGGGGIGSTAGGFKLMRLLLLFFIMTRCVVRMGLPNRAVQTRKWGGKVIDDREILDALLIVFAFLGVVFVSWTAFLYYGYSPLDSLFEVVSATATVGLSSGVTAEMLPASLKLVLCADMLFGRLEFIAWMVLLYPRTWFGRQRES